MFTKKTKQLINIPILFQQSTQQIIVAFSIQLQSITQPTILLYTNIITITRWDWLHHYIYPKNFRTDVFSLVACMSMNKTNINKKKKKKSVTFSIEEKPSKKAKRKSISADIGIDAELDEHHASTTTGLMEVCKFFNYYCYYYYYQLIVFVIKNRI